MLKYLATAALTLISIPALADATGAGFCTVMQEEMASCIEEAGTTSGHRCPNAIVEVKASYQGTKDEPSKAMRAELQNANAVWMGLAQQPARGSGESKADYKARMKAGDASIARACAKLRKLDQ
jgi:hypothetical protein